MRSMQRGGGRFLMDTLSNGRCLKCLTIVDDFTKEAVDIVVDHSISGLYVDERWTTPRASEATPKRGTGTEGQSLRAER